MPIQTYGKKKAEAGQKEPGPPRRGGNNTSASGEDHAEKRKVQNNLKNLKEIVIEEGVGNFTTAEKPRRGEANNAQHIRISGLSQVTKESKKKERTGNLERTQNFGARVDVDGKGPKEFTTV